MDAQDLRDFRKRAGLSQAELAERLGLSHRAYQGLEAGEAAIRGVHRLALEALSARLAVELREPMIATAEARVAAMGLYQLLFPQALVTDPGPVAGA